jgi:hypothetical protein
MARAACVARPLRSEFPDALHRVTASGDGREDIYRCDCDGDRRGFLEMLAGVWARRCRPCLGGYHGDDEVLVFKELCRVVDELIELYKQDGKPLPASTAGHDLANKLQDVA